MSDCPRGGCFDANKTFRKWKLGLEVLKLSVLSDTQNNSVDQACHDRLWSLSWLILSFIFWHIYDLSFHLNRWPVAIRQRRTVRSGQERCYLRCHSCSSYLAFIFLFSHHLAFVSFHFPISLFLSHRCAQSARKLRGSLILSPSVRRWENFLARPLKLLWTFERNQTNKIWFFLQIPQELCGPSGCGFVQGPEICHDEVWSISFCHFTVTLSFPPFFWRKKKHFNFQTKTIVTDIPQEVCDLQPQRSCKKL